MIERLQKISQELFKNALKTYTLKDLLVHKRAHANNLTEILSMYPNQGIGFHVRRKTWLPQNQIQIKRAVFKSHRHGHFYGVRVAVQPDNTVKILDQYPKRCQGFNKRGVWAYDFGKFQKFKADNGVEYTRADFEAFRKIRSIGITKPVAQKPAESTEQAGNPPQNTQAQGQ